MSCGCNSGYDGGIYGGVCDTDTPYPSVSHESVPSLIDNLVYALYGVIQKDVTSGKVVWNIPCDPSNIPATINNIPRNEGEGLLCYIIRALNLTIPTNGFVTVDGVQTLTNKTLTAPVINTATINNLTATGTLALPTGSITSAMIADGTIVNADINESAAIAISKLAPVTATGSTTARSLPDRFADIINVKDFGAVGDGVTDDTAALQAALNRATAIDNCCVYIPYGKYKITASLNLPTANNIFIKGDGQGASNLIFSNNSGLSVTLLGFSQLNNFGISNLTLSANQQGGTALTVSNATNIIESSILFQDIEITSFSGVHQTNPLTYWANGISVNSLRFCTFNNISIWGGEGAPAGAKLTNKGIAINATTTDAQYNFTFNNIKIINCTYGIYGFGYLEGIYATNGEIWVCDYPVYIDRTGVANQNGTIRFTNFHLNAAKVGATFINTGHVGIESCDVVRSIAFAGDFDTLLLSNVNRAAISGNYFWSGNGATNCVRVQNCDNVTVTGNVFGGSTGAVQLYNYLAIENTDVYTVSNNTFNGTPIANDTGITTDASCSNGSIGLNAFLNLTTNVIDSATNKSNPKFCNNAVNISSEAGVGSLSLAGAIPNITFNPSGSTAKDCYMDFRSSGLAGYDTRIIAASGTGTSSVGNGTLIINAKEVAIGQGGVTGLLRPSSDNLFTLGAPSYRWSTVYAATGSINTSDAREKQQIRDLSESEKAVAVRLKGLIKAFKFNDAVDKKGDNARIHFGVIAQDVKAAFESQGLVAENYALLCYDEWEEKDEIKDDEGNVIQPYQAAGNRYGVRYDELFAFIISQL